MGDSQAAAAQHHRPGLTPVPHGSAIGVVPAPRPADGLGLLIEQGLRHRQTGSDGHGHQPVPGNLSDAGQLNGEVIGQIAQQPSPGRRAGRGLRYDAQFRYLAHDGPLPGCSLAGSPEIYHLVISGGGPPL